MIVTVRSSARLDVLDLAGVRSVMEAALAGERAAAHVPLETGGSGYRSSASPFAVAAASSFGDPAMTKTRFVFAVTAGVDLESPHSTCAR